MKIEKLYKIGEVMAYSGLTRQTIHNYTVMGLIVEERRTETGGHRLYAESVFADLEKIKRLKEEGRTLLEIKEIMERERQERSKESE